MEIRTLAKKDYKKAIQFAIKGMHFDWYMGNRTILQLYGQYFLYMELNKATQVLAAYEGEQLLGILLAQVYGEKQCCYSGMRDIYVKLFDWLQKKIAKESIDLYDDANKEMYIEYVKKIKPDGEIIFLAADLNSGRKGVGSFLLEELEKREIGKELFLYTDNACTYQFYEKRGFERFAERQIELHLEQEVSLNCYIYRKKIEGSSITGICYNTTT